jgi:hypothetical protein
MDIRINIVEVATILADRDLITSFGDEGGKHRFPNGIILDLDDETSHTEEAQDYVNARYDYWYDFLWDLKIGEEYE